MFERLLFVGKLATSRQTCAFLEQQGYEVMHVEGLRPTLRALNEFDATVVIIDANDTSLINTERITHTAGRRNGKPFIILLTSDRSRSFDKIVYDAILVRPFTHRRLEEQIRKILNTRQDYVVTLGPLTLDRRTKRVKTPTGTARLTPKQFQLLDYLIQHHGELVTRRQLMREVWETTYLGDTRTLDVHIRWLRERLEEDPSHPTFIRTHRGRGYSLDIEGPVETGGEPLL